MLQSIFVLKESAHMTATVITGSKCIKKNQNKVFSFIRSKYLSM
jgi:hypothetical protein